MSIMLRYSEVVRLMVPAGKIAVREAPYGASCTVGTKFLWLRIPGSGVLEKKSQCGVGRWGPPLPKMTTDLTPKGSGRRGIKPSSLIATVGPTEEALETRHLARPLLRGAKNQARRLA